MKFEPIIVSPLDTDLYKFNMDQVIFHKHTDLTGKYIFKCRNENVKFNQEMVQEIDQIDHLCVLCISQRKSWNTFVLFVLLRMTMWNSCAFIIHFATM